jgi:methyl-accepting chemotaxis protein
MKTRKNSIFKKILAGYIVAAAIVWIISFIIGLNASGIKNICGFVKDDFLPNTINGKNLQIHVIQVQQWLTDISATRGAEGYDDGYDEAEKHAEEARRLLNEFKQLFEEAGDDENVRAVEELKVKFEAFYDMGKKMAAAYIEYGPSAGNEFMEEFDPFAEEIYNGVNAFVEELNNLLDESVNNISRQTAALFTISVLIGLISTGLLIAIGISLSYLIVKPIKEFSGILENISEGEGDLTQRIEVKSKDEIGEMAESFNKTFEKIRMLVKKVKELCEVLGGSSSDLASNMSETAAAINQISANIKSIQRQTVNQSASVTETSSTMEQISGGISNLTDLINNQAENITESSVAIDSLIKNISQVASTIEQNSENMIKLSESSDAGKTSLDKINAALHDVEKESQGLMEISQVISSIAGQTNLLAMNAAIEAAHAGESGKGFAVVADEVRKLAESSNVQTKTIKVVLKKIKDSISQIINLSEEVVEKFTVIEKGVETVASQEETIKDNVIEQTGESQKILESIKGLNAITEKVRLSSQEMLEGTRQITLEARNMNAITEEINGGMIEMATGADQITEAIDVVNNLSSENKNSIDTLIDEVNRFKI